MSSVDRSVDAIIVLSNEMDAYGQLNLVSRMRADTASSLYFSMRPQALIVCGWNYRSDCDMPIAEAFKRYLLTRHGVPESAIHTECHARDTVGEAFFSKKNLVVPKSWKRLVIVTSSYHLPRAEEIFRFVYGPGYQLQFEAVETPMVNDPGEAELASLAAFRNTFKDVMAGDTEAISNAMQARHPFYNGDRPLPI